MWSNDESWWLNAVIMRDKGIKGWKGTGTKGWKAPKMRQNIKTRFLGVEVLGHMLVGRLVWGLGSQPSLAGHPSLYIR